MLVFLLLCSVISYLRGSTHGAHEIGSSALPSSDAYLVARTDIVFSKRELSDIITTCMATIFACTWTAIHPNISSPVDSVWELFTRRVTISLCALIAPELITAWALRQYIAAKKIAREYNKNIVNGHELLENAPPDRHPLLDDTADMAHDQTVESISRESPSIARRAVVFIKNGFLWLPKKIFCPPPLPAERLPGMIQPWTTAHGFFVQMGGFMLSANGVPLRTLYFYPEDPTIDISALIKSKSICAPTVTEDEIKDRSKGNLLSKTVVIGHTTWFLAQCIARWATGLTVTKLEVVTLGYVILNGITYAFWWNKPQDVGVPVYLEWTSPNLAPMPPSKLNKRSDFRKDIATAVKKRTCNICALMLDIVVAISVAPMLPLLKLSVNPDRARQEREIQLRVSAFHHDHIDDSTTLITLVFPMTAIAVIFGSVHLIPVWLNDFQVRSQFRFWRLCAGVTTAAPLLLSMNYSIYKINKDLAEAFYVLSVCTGLFYFFARISLLVLAIISLFNLPPSAFVTIQWLSMVPHL